MVNKMDAYEKEVQRVKESMARDYDPIRKIIEKNLMIKFIQINKDTLTSEYVSFDALVDQDEKYVEMLKVVKPEVIDQLRNYFKEEFERENRNQK